MSTRHTPGPWVANHDYTVTTGNGNSLVATVLGPDEVCVSPAQAAADAHVMAAAPELLVALQDLLAVLKPDRGLLPLAYERAERAVAKANGSAP